MNMARYYFEHPKMQGGTGYKLAEETYHKYFTFAITRSSFRPCTALAGAIICRTSTTRP